MTDSTMVVLGATSFALVVVLYVWFALALAAVFRKAGRRTWKAWVPVVNVATVLELGGFSPWLVMLNVIPLFGAVAFFVVFVVAVHRVTVAFGRGAGSTVVGAIAPVVWASILGWGAAQWQRPREPARSDDDSAPAAREHDVREPRVQLVGGWTPAPTGGADSDEAAAASQPVIVPFAAPVGTLADAVPSGIDWAPPLEPSSASFDGARGDGDVARERDEAPRVAASSVFEVLDALRDGSPADGSDARPGSTQSSLTGQERPVALDADDDPQEPVAPWAASPRRAARGETRPVTPIANVPLTRSSPADAVRPDAVDARADDDFPEASEAVSAVAETPAAGSPRSARSSVAALYTRSELPSAPTDDDLDRTVLTRRRRIPWVLVPPNGVPVDLTSTVVILGRRPAQDAAFPDAQLVPVVDETRTVSKTHARLQLKGDTWFVTDLDSTNGVLFATLMGTEVEAPPGEEIEAGERFFLGDAEVRLSRSDA